MPHSLKAFAAAFVVVIAQIIPVQVSAQEPKFRYYAIEKIAAPLENGETSEGTKLCIWGGEWSPLFSANPDVAKGFRPVPMQLRRAIAQAAAVNVCDVVALRVAPEKNLDVPDLDQLVKKDSDGRLRPIVSLNLE